MTDLDDYMVPHVGPPVVSSAPPVVGRPPSVHQLPTQSDGVPPLPSHPPLVALPSSRVESTSEQLSSSESSKDHAQEGPHSDHSSICSPRQIDPLYENPQQSCGLPEVFIALPTHVTHQTQSSGAEAAVVPEDNVPPPLPSEQAAEQLSIPPPLCPPPSETAEDSSTEPNEESSASGKAEQLPSPSSIPPPACPPPSETPTHSAPPTEELFSPSSIPPPACSPPSETPADSSPAAEQVFSPSSVLPPACDPPTESVTGKELPVTGEAEQLPSPSSIPPPACPPPNEKPSPEDTPQLPSPSSIPPPACPPPDAVPEEKPATEQPDSIPPPVCSPPSVIPLPASATECAGPLHNSRPNSTRSVNLNDVNLNDALLEHGFTIRELRDNRPLLGILAQSLQLCLVDSQAITMISKIRSQDLRQSSHDPRLVIQSIGMLQKLLSREAQRAECMLGICGAQALLASRCARNHYLEVQDEYCEKRNESIKELVKAESMFLYKLKIVINRFMVPLEQSLLTSNPLISANEIRTVFGNIKDLVVLHEGLLSNFRAVLDNWPSVRGLGEKILAFSPKLGIYGHYVKNCPAAMQTVTNLRRDNPAFDAFVKDAESRLPSSLIGIELGDLLSCPLNQIGMYSMLLQRILDGTDPVKFAGQEFTSLTNAVTVLRHLHNVVQVSFELSHNRLKTVQTEALLGGMKDYPGDENRRFIGYWNVVIFSKQNLAKKYRNRHLFLFSDYAVFTKPKVATVTQSVGGGPPQQILMPVGGRQLCRVKEVVKLDQISVKDDRPVTTPSSLSSSGPGSAASTPGSSSGSPGGTGSGVKSHFHSIGTGLLGRHNVAQLAQAQTDSSFTLTSPHFSCVVRMDTPADKINLISQLETLSQQCHSDVQVFGIDLSSLLLRENRLHQVPLIVEMLTDYIRTNLDLEGLFRVAPEMQEAKDLKKFFDTGQHLTNPDGLKNFSIHCAANVFKMYFREMPEPLFPFNLYDPLLNAEAQGLPASEMVKLLTDKLKSVPPVNKTLLHYVMTFFTEVVNHSDKNMMTASNISIVFAANVIRPKMETVESTLALPRVSSIFETVLLNSSIWCHLID